MQICTQRRFVAHLRALFLEELGADLLADDVGTDVVLDSDAQPHLLQDELHLLLLRHGAVRLHLARGGGQTQSKLTTQNYSTSFLVCESHSHHLPPLGLLVL